MDTTSETEACPIAELVHLVVSSCMPHLTLVSIFESENKVLTRAVEATAEEPFFGAKASKLVLILIFDYHESGIWTLQFIYEGVHRHTMLTKSV